MTQHPIFVDILFEFSKREHIIILTFLLIPLVEKFLVALLLLCFVRSEFVRGVWNVVPR